MLRNILLTVAILSLFFGLWMSWSHFQGAIDRDTFLNRLYLVTLLWFVCASAWTYLAPPEKD